MYGPAQEITKYFVPCRWYQRRLNMNQVELSKGRYTDHVVFSWPISTSPTPLWFYVILRERQPHPEKNKTKIKKHVAFLKKNGYFPPGCLRHKRTLVIIVICYILWTKYGTVLSVSINIGRGKKRWYCEQRGWAARTRKSCAFKDSVSYVSGITTVSAYGNSKKRPRVPFCFCRTPPPTPSSPSWFDVVLHGDHLPLSGPRGLCTVPNS